MELNALKRILAKYSQRVWDRGYVANHDGNLSARISKDKILATPTSFSKTEVQEDDLLVIDLNTGKVVTGRHKPFSELDMHIEFYKSRMDVKAIIHAHPPIATGFAVAGIEVEPRMLPEAVVSLGDRIPLAPTAFPGRLDSTEQVRYLAKLYDVFTLGNHGVLSCGSDVEQAFLRLELVEHLAKIQQVAMMTGNLRLIHPDWVRELLAKRKKAGLGPEARSDVNAAVIPKMAELPVEQIISRMVETLKK